jgi:ADP-heptose:LPS heptosyltransferase
MVSARKVYHRLRAVRALQRTLESHPGHFRGLILSFARNAARLAALKLRARLSRRKLTVIGLAERMGDIVACEPVSRRLRGLYPGDIILWAVRPGYRDLVKGNAHLDGDLRIHCITEWLWLRELGLFDRTCDLHIKGKYCGICQYHFVQMYGVGNVTLHNYFNYGSLLRSFSLSAGYPMDEGGPSVYIDRDAVRAVDGLDLPRRYVTIHGTSAEECKNWERGKWEQLVAYLIEVHKIAVVELGQQSCLKRPDVEGYINLCAKCSILESAEVIRRSSLFIGVDSGPAHLANAVQTRGVILLGRYNSFRQYLPYTGFYSDPANCRIIQSEGTAAEIPVELCLPAVDDALRPLSASSLSNPELLPADRQCERRH